MNIYLTESQITEIMRLCYAAIDHEQAELRTPATSQFTRFQHRVAEMEIETWQSIVDTIAITREMEFTAGVDGPVSRDL